MVNKLISFMRAVYKVRPEDFTGIGLIVVLNETELPVTDLRATIPNPHGKGVISMLSDISAESCEFHDGFHVLNDALEITKTSQFFSPEIQHDIDVDRTKIIGGRYMAALHGSCIKNVILCSIISSKSELYVFENGQEVYSEKLL